VDERTGTLFAGHYLLAIQGLALIRNLIDSGAAAPRMDEIRDIAARLDEFPFSMEIPLFEYDTDDGYTRWAPVYDGPNPAIEGEQPVVHGILETLPAGVALDAACGTGRHAAKLAALGHQVIGVDANEAMLELAAAKIPEADLRRGQLESLPVDDESVDLVTCALALTHVPDLDPVIREFGRVLRPGGTAVLSDMHPFVVMSGGSLAGFSSGDLTAGIPFVRNLTHQISDYLRAFKAAGLSIVDCIEPLFGEVQLRALPAYGLYPDASRQAFEGHPYLLIWRLARSEH
jgi:ubiquinone/menaquinone biosynthesis C-methylase UbiE